VCLVIGIDVGIQGGIVSVVGITMGGTGQRVCGVGGKVGVEIHEKVHGVIGTVMVRGGVIGAQVGGFVCLVIGIDVGIQGGIVSVVGI
jgi:hypothetical protein